MAEKWERLSDDKDIWTNLPPDHPLIEGMNRSLVAMREAVELHNSTPCAEGGGEAAFWGCACGQMTAVACSACGAPLMAVGRQCDCAQELGDLRPFVSSSGKVE